MKKSKMEALLARPLSTIESTNYDLYLSLAESKLEDLLCISLKQEYGVRYYLIRDNYKTVFTDIFNRLEEVKINGTVTTAFTAQLDGNLNSKWYNSIVLNNLTSGTVSIKADWGYDCLPNDLDQLLASLFNLHGQMATGNGNVSSKKIEDFSISYNGNSVYDQFLIDNASVISKYSQCQIGEIQHGYVDSISDY